MVPRVTSDLPLNPISLKPDWTHLKNISLPDPQFDTPGRIDLLLGVDVYVDLLLHNQWSGPPGSPVAYKTIFGCVLAGRTHSEVTHHVMSHHMSASLTNDDILHRFWEMEESPPNENSSIEDQSVINHFKGSYRQCKEGRLKLNHWVILDLRQLCGL